MFRIRLDIEDLILNRSKSLGLNQSKGCIIYIFRNKNSNN
nr:translational initiation factor 1 [Hypecoum erectum]BET06383.1 translational initiation factor 1 [Hypecoum erectum]